MSGFLCSKMTFFQSATDAQLTAFQYSTIIRLRQKSRRAVVPRRPRACSEQQEIRSSETPKSPVQTTPMSSPSTSSRVLRKEGLINRPEAVLGFLAVGFFSSMTYLAYAGRRIAADVAARAKKITSANSQTQRYKARLHEKAFLESAIQATTATLGNTEDFLKKQIIRAEHAETRLRELEVNSSEVDDLMRRKNELTIELKEKEAELENKRLRTRENKELLVSNEADLRERRAALSQFEKDFEQARRELLKAQQAASQNLKSALAERSELEGILELKQVQLAEEKTARAQFLQRISAEEEKLKQTEELVDQTLSDIEARRSKIDTVAKEAEHIGKVTSQEKLALEAAVVREVRADDIEESVQQIRAKQNALRKQIQNSRKSEAQQAAHCIDLKKEIEERGRLLGEQRKKLNELHQGNRIPKGSRSSTAEVREQKVKYQAALDDWQVTSNGTSSPHDLFKSAVIHDNVQSISFSASATMTKPKGSTTVSTAVGDDDEIPVKRRRGRPRKSDSNRPQEVKETKAKRGRGRPRTRLVDDGMKESVPKRKRGRPRKSSVTATQKSSDQSMTNSSLIRQGNASD